MKSSKLAIGIIIATMLFIGVVFAKGLFENTSQVSPPDQAVACTEEAKLCPDGSAVGREGPNCEFPECPAEAPSVKL